MAAAATPVDRRALGGSGRTVSSVALGTAALGLPYGAPGGERPAPPPAVARETIEEAVKAGVTFFDTAPTYGDAERLVGEAIGDDERCFVATKLQTPPGGWAQLSADRVRVAVRASLERSLERLRRPSVEMLQIHNADRTTVNSANLIESLEELREEGLVATIGATVYGEDDALAVLESRSFDSVQVAYGPLDRRAERGVIPRAGDVGVGIVARSVMLRGVLSPAGRSMPNELAPLRIAAERFRDAMGAGWEELPGAALAFVLARPGISAALIGPRDAVELASLLADGARFTATAKALGPFDAAVPESLLDPRQWASAPP